MMNKLEDWFYNEKHRMKCYKWVHYFDIYEKHFKGFRKNKNVRILEIGVYNGGSLEMWDKYFPKSEIIGIDINPDCLELQKNFGDNVQIVIGDQANPNFWNQSSSGIIVKKELRSQMTVALPNLSTPNVLGVDGTDQDYDLLTLNRNLTANDLKVYTGTVYNPNLYKNGIQTPITRANNEIFVYNRISKDKYKGRTLRIGSSEYEISDIQSLLAEGEPALQGIANATAMEKLVLNIPLVDSFVNEQNISIAAFKDIPESKNFLLNSTDTEPTATKTFTVKVLGEVDSTITWTTATSLGTLKANLTSHLKLEATSSVADAKMKYLLTGGTLPPGLSLSLDGEIVGNVRLYSENSLPGITSFDNNLLTLDGGTTTVDESYSFTVRAQDRFGFSSVERTFTLAIDTNVTKTFTDC